LNPARVAAFFEHIGGFILSDASFEVRGNRNYFKDPNLGLITDAVTMTA